LPKNAYNGQAGVYVQMMRRLPTMMLTVSMAAALAACGGGSSGGSSPTKPAGEPTSGPAAQAAITTLYENFFSAPVPQAKTMLEDGSSLSAAFKAALKLKGNVTESAKVKTVTISGPTTADVTFELDGDGTPLIPSSNGQAVYVNGKWLVAKQTFCTLVELGGNPNIPGC
jgi:hypothetical protein